MKALVIGVAIAGWVWGAKVERGRMIGRDSFVKVAPSESEMVHEVIFAIVQRNLDVLESIVNDRSTPGSKSYQQWMTFNEVGDLISNPRSTEHVEVWLKQNKAKITWVSPRKEFVKALAPIRVWNAILDASFYNWTETSPESGYDGHFIRTETYSLPEDIHPHVHDVFNTIHMPPLLSKRHRHPMDDNIYKTVSRIDRNNLEEALSADDLPGVEPIFYAEPIFSTEPIFYDEGGLGDPVPLANVVSSVTPSYLNQYYGISTNVGTNTQSQSVFQTNSQSYSKDDLARFQSFFGIPLQTIVDVGPYAAIDGCTSSTCGEGNLDIQVMFCVHSSI